MKIKIHGQNRISDRVPEWSSRHHTEIMFTFFYDYLTLDEITYRVLQRPIVSAWTQAQTQYAAFTLWLGVELVALLAGIDGLIIWSALK